MCNSLSTRNGNVNKVCTFRFKPSEYKGCQIDNIFRDSEGRITQVNIVRNGLAEFKQYEKYPPIANDILSIWKEKCNNWYCAVFYNIQNGITAKVNFYQINNITKYKTLWGDVKYPMSSNYEINLSRIMIQRNGYSFILIRIIKTGVEDNTGYRRDCSPIALFFAFLIDNENFS